MSDTLFLFGSVPLTGFGCMMGLALLAVLLCAAPVARLRRMHYGAFIRLVVVCIPMGWLVSRLVYVLANCTYYLTTLSNPVLALRFWDGGYSVSGAMLGLWLGAVVAAKWAHTDTADMLDAISYGMPLGLVIERLSESGTGMGLGRAISYDWLTFLGIDDGMGDLVHPVYRYEAVVAAVLFAVLTVMLLRRRDRLPKGDLTLVFMSLYGATQALLESLRNDGHMVVHFVRIQQCLFLIFALVAFGIYLHRCMGKGCMKKSQQLLCWLIAIVCVGVCAVMEFRVDRGTLKWLYYTVMLLCLGVMTGMTFRFRHLSQRWHNSTLHCS